MHRPTIGILAAIFFIGGFLAWLLPQVSVYYSALGQMGIRIGTVLAALWLAHPHLNRLPRWLLLAVPPVAIVLAARPKLVPIAIVIIVVMILLRPRGTASSKKS